MKHTIINTNNIDKHWFLVCQNNPVGRPHVIYACDSLSEAYNFKQNVLDSHGYLYNKTIFVDEWIKFRNGSVVYVERTHFHMACMEN